MKAAIRFPPQKKGGIPKQVGELCRVQVVQGPDEGTTYVLLRTQATLGRDEENDLVLSDLKASRVHARISMQAGRWMIQDEQSSNGLYHQGQKVRVVPLRSGQIVTLGETALRFTLNEKKNKKSPPFLLYLLVGGVGLFFFLGDDEPPSPEKKAPLSLSGKEAENTPSSAKDPALSSYLPSGKSLPGTEKELQLLFNLGRREYFLGNYNRARTQFETVLQINPDHSLAQLYLQNCLKSVEEDVKLHLEYGKKSLDAGKLKDAKAHFVRVLRLLERDQTNPFFIESKEQLSHMTEEGGK